MADVNLVLQVGSDSAAAAYAQQANASAQASAASAASASDSATAASGSATQAANSASAAATSATQAGGSATAAGESASAAAQSATAAGTAKTNAQNSASAAATSASNAALSATQASGSATSAASSASAASGSATTASTKAGEAAASASAASTSASNASASATSANNAKTAAETAKTGAETARDQAQAYAGSIASVYSNTATYAVDDYCFHEGQLQRCIVPITTPEAWTAAHWVAVELGDDVSDLKTALNDYVTQTDLATTLDDYVTEDALDAFEKGTHEDMTVGDAEQLLSDVYTENSEPYLFRKTGGSDKVGDREYLDKIVGGSLAWNQLTGARNEASYKWSAASAIGEYADGIYTFTANGASGYAYINFSVKADHVYVSTVEIKTTTETTDIQTDWYGGSPMTRCIASTDWQYIRSVKKITSTSMNRLTIRDKRTANWDAIQARNMMVIDLTAEFGTTIADYVYSLETATAGTGIAWLCQYIDLDTYHPYSEPTLKHVEGLVSHDTVGFNQFDINNQLGFKGYISSGVITTSGATGRKIIYIPCLPNTKYVASRKAVNNDERFYIGYTTELPANGVPVYDYHYAPTSQTIGNTMTITTTTGANAKYVVLWAYWSNNVEALDTLSISFNDPLRNGVYEPYQKRSYPLDSSVVLRGIPTLVDGRLKFDGDEYLPDGTINRKYGIVDLGTLTWTLAITNNQFMYSTGIASDVKKPASNGSVANIICPIALTTSATGVDVASGAFIGIVTNGNIRLRYDGFSTDPETFKAAVSGVYLVYELATPTTEQAEPYRQREICDGYGTEEFVCTNPLVPVGTETRYPENLREKIEGLPWNLSMIAPIENGTTASQAYTTGQYFLRNNVFCKAKTNIASGATFTLNTNYEETTIAAELYAALH